MPDVGTNRAAVEAVWAELLDAQVDYINTDQVDDCRRSCSRTTPAVHAVRVVVGEGASLRSVTTR